MCVKKEHLATGFIMQISVFCFCVASLLFEGTSIIHKEQSETFCLIMYTDPNLFRSNSQPLPSSSCFWSYPAPHASIPRRRQRQAHPNDIVQHDHRQQDPSAALSLLLLFWFGVHVPLERQQHAGAEEN